MTKPAVLLFDVNETLLDIEALRPFFERVFGDGRVLRDWYAQLVIYSQAVTFADRYLPFGTLGGGVLRMLATIHGVEVSDGDVEELGERTRGLPAHHGAATALARLRAAGYRLATLTNSAPSGPPSPLEKAGLASFLDASVSVDAVRRFKPAPGTYRAAAEALRVPPGHICMVAAHVWDLLGAQAVGCATALVAWPGNAPLPLADLPQPDIVAPTLEDLAEAVIRRWS